MKRGRTNGTSNLVLQKRSIQVGRFGSEHLLIVILIVFETGPKRVDFRAARCILSESRRRVSNAFLASGSRGRLKLERRRASIGLKHCDESRTRIEDRETRVER